MAEQGIFSTGPACPLGGLHSAPPDLCSETLMCVGDGRMASRHSINSALRMQASSAMRPSPAHAPEIRRIALSSGYRRALDTQSYHEQWQGAYPQPPRPAYKRPACEVQHNPELAVRAKAAATHPLQKPLSPAFFGAVASSHRSLRVAMDCSALWSWYHRWPWSDRRTTRSSVSVGRGDSCCTIAHSE